MNADKLISHIAILGAGVGGVTIAIALIQRGYKISIFERTPEPAHIGAGIVVWPNASFVLSEMGLLSKIAALAGRPEKMQRMSAQGEDLGYIDITALDKRMGFSSYAILRRDLQSVLLGELSRQGVEVLYDHSVSSIVADGHGKTTINFKNGLQLKPDIVIGADGRMKSIARQFVNGNNKPIYQGFINWIGVYESDANIVNEMSVFDVWGIGERFGVVPITKNKVYWAGAKVQEIIDPAELSSNKEELSSIFHSWPNPIPDIIRKTPELLIKKIFVHDHDPIATWYKDNVILIGDSAHASLPTSGQGACQAMEDAWHLANYLQAYPSSIQVAFETFSETRREKTATIIYAARSFAASLFNRDAEFCRQRNAQSKLTDYFAVVESMARYWGQGLPIRE